MKEKQDIYLSELILWEMVCDRERDYPNDADFGEVVREMVKNYGK